ncbi:hypothetical protein K439DRAFT_1248997, partial [Ramaria rubella]
RISTHSKHWWTKELTALRKNYAKKSRAEFNSRNTDSWLKHRHKSNQAWNTYTAALRKTKTDHWKGWLENIDENDIWMAGRYAKNPLSD